MSGEYMEEEKVNHKQTYKIYLSSLVINDKTIKSKKQKYFFPI